MQNYSYLLSPTVSTEIKNIDITRRNILLAQASPAIETELRFETLIDVISQSLRLSGKSASNKEIYSALSSNKESEFVQEIVSIKRAYDYMRHFLVLTGKEIRKEDLIELLAILVPHKKYDSSKIQTIVDFINVSSEHSIVQSAICFALLLDSLSMDNDSIKIAVILSEVFAYNHGYDLKGMLNLQEFFFSDFINLRKKIDLMRGNKNLSELIEYYTQAFSIKSEAGYKILQDKNPVRSSLDSKSILTERQSRILGLFDIPESKVSNKTVQKEFGVSQITASRDLSRLAVLGLIFQKGQGRSIYYIKI